MNQATEYLHKIPRIDKIDAGKKINGDVLLLPDNVELYFQEDTLVKTSGLGEKLDGRKRDLLRIIELQDPLNLVYRETNILSPLSYVESLSDIPWHISTQGVLFVRITNSGIKWIKEQSKSDKYGKHELDKFWLPFCPLIDTIQAGDLLSVFNRRVGGWDGSYERPVIELLGAGGHLPTVWDPVEHHFKSLTFKENFKKEFREELGVKIDEDNVKVLGGFSNDITHELVVFCAIEISEEMLFEIQNYAIQHIDEDTEGIYLGTFLETMEYYRVNPTPFAGGVASAPYNFPNRKDLMKKVYRYLKNL